jgi:hypothetical protein
MTAYDSDIAAWAAEQAEALRQRSTNTLDWDNLADEIEGVAASQRKEIRSRLKILCQHLLKWQYQPGQRSRGLRPRATISVQRDEIGDLLETSPSLQSYPATVLDRAYITARNKTELETNLLHLPASCPWSIEEVLDTDFLPVVPD